MGKHTKDKVKVTLTIDRELVEKAKFHRFKLSTLINNYLRSLFSEPSSLSPFQAGDLGSNPSTCITNKGLESGDGGVELKNTYFLRREQFKDYLKSKEKTDCYIRDLLNTLDKAFQHSINTPHELVKWFSKQKGTKKYLYLAIRNYLHFLESEELIHHDTLQYLKGKIKRDRNLEGIDSFIPDKNSIEMSLQRLKSVYPGYEPLYRLVLESGCRYTELRDMILNFDSSRVEEWDNEIILYRNFRMKGQKSSFYMFFRKETFESVNFGDYTERELNHFKNIIKKNEDIVSLKYLRKYQFSCMIEAGVSFEIANFIQGRSSQNVGFNHYLAKKTIAVREYKKILSLLR